MHAIFTRFSVQLKYALYNYTILKLFLVTYQEMQCIALFNHKTIQNINRSCHTTFLLLEVKTVFCYCWIRIFFFPQLNSYHLSKNETSLTGYTSLTQQPWLNVFKSADVKRFTWMQLIDNLVLCFSLVENLVAGRFYRIQEHQPCFYQSISLQRSYKTQLK